MAPKMHAGKKQSRRMKGGMTTGQWGTAVYGDSSSQQAVGAGLQYGAVNVACGCRPQIRRHRGACVHVRV